MKDNWTPGPDEAAPIIGARRGVLGIAIAAAAAGLGVEEGAGGLCGERQLVGGALAHALGIAVAPDRIRDDTLVAVVDVVADRLDEEVCPRRVLDRTADVEAEQGVGVLGGDGGR